MINKIIFLVSFILVSKTCYSKTCNEYNNQKAWIWPLSHKRIQSSSLSELFLLQLRFQKKTLFFEKLGPAPHKIENKKMTIVMRLQSLPLVEDLIKNYLILKKDWNQRGTEVTGLQLDFDSPTGQLDTYADYLLKLKSKLASEEKLSITGLPDWINQSSSFQTKLLQSDIVIYFQMYQGNVPALKTNEYLDFLNKYKLKYAVGFLPDQNINETRINVLNTTKNFEGILCFYRN